MTARFHHLRALAVAATIAAAMPLAMSAGASAAEPLTVPPASAGPAAPHPPGSELPPGILRTLTKAAVFETLSSTLEAAAFYGFFGAGTASLPVVFAASLASAATVYVAHDLVWDAALGPDRDPADPAVIAGKSATYRVVNTVRSFALGSVLGGVDAAASAAFALTVAVADTALYAGIEYLFATRPAAAAAP
ncbi:MAG: hypothetical protein AB7P02_00245 [Alphaproteobacteria bacterium]